MAIKTVTEWFELLNNGPEFGTGTLPFDEGENATPPLFDRGDTITQPNINDVRNFAAALKLNPACSKLVLEEYLNDEAITLIMEALLVNTNVKILDLTNNDFGLVGGLAIAETMKQNKSIQELSIGTNSLASRQFALAMQGMLKNNTTLKLLDCSAISGLKGDVLIVLLMGLETNKTLETLVLRENNLDASDLIMLGHMLKHNKGIKKLDLIANNALVDFNSSHIRFAAKGFFDNLNRYNNTLNELIIWPPTIANPLPGFVTFIQHFGKHLEWRDVVRKKQEKTAIAEAITFTQGKSQQRFIDFPNEVFKLILYFILKGLKSDEFVKATVEVLYKNIVDNRIAKQNEWWGKSYGDVAIFRVWKESTLTLFRTYFPQELQTLNSSVKRNASIENAPSKKSK